MSKAAIAGGIAAAVLLPVGIWGVGVATADLRGAGNAHKIERSAGNRIAAQERFHDRYQDILATDRKLDVMAQAAKAGDTARQTEYLGTVAYCLSAVGDYNADARKFTAQAFRDADLPDQIDPNDPNTDCKEELTK